MMNDTLEIAKKCGMAVNGSLVMATKERLQSFREECEKPLQNAIAHYKNDQFCAADTEKRLRTQLAEAQARIKVLEDALNKLARLGNGDKLGGNSIGNQIAQEALASAEAIRKGDKP